MVDTYMLHFKILHFSNKVEHKFENQVGFCLKVYFSNWLDIKLNSKILERAVNYFHMFKQIMQFPRKQTKDIALKTFDAMASQPTLKTPSDTG